MIVSQLTTAMASNNGSNFVQANAVFAGTNATGTIASNGISISVAPPGAGGGVAISGGTNSQSTGTVNFSNSNGVTFGLNTNGVMTASVNTNYQAPGAYLTTAMLSNAVTLSNIKVSAGTLSALRSDISFNNSNGISFGLETNGVITGTVATNYQSSNANYLTSQSNQAVSFTSGSVAFQTLSFTNSNGISFNSGTQGIFGSHNGITSQSNQPIYYSASNGLVSNSSTLKFVEGSGVTWATQANGIQASVKTDYQSSNANYLISQSNQNASASNGSFNFQTLAFSNANNVTFGTSAGSIITASVAAPGGGGAALKGSGTYTQNTGTIEFANSNGITFGLSNNGTMTASHNGITQQSTQPVAVSGSNGSFNFSTLSFGNLNGLSFYTSNGSIVGSYTDAGAGGGISAVIISAGTTNSAVSNFSFANSNGISFGINGSTITGSAGFVRQSFDNLGPLATASGALGGKAIAFGSLSVFPLKPFADIFNGSMTIGTIGLDMSISGSTATLSGALSSSARLGLYTIDTTAATLSLGLLNSVIISFGHAGAATNNSTAWQGQRYFTAHSSQWSSQPVLSDGVEYVVGLIINSGGASSAQSNTIQGGFMFSTAAKSGFIGANPSAATWNGYGKFLGIYSAGTTGLPAGINYTQINKQSASANFVPHIVGYNHTNMTAP